MTVIVSIFTVMKDDKQFSLNELSALVDLPGRTIRYYIQSGLLNKPLGKGRGAHYDASHVEQLLQIKKWSDAGISLERIGELLLGDTPDIPPRQKKPGDIEVWSHLHISDGIELKIEPSRAGLSPEQVRVLSTQVMALYETLQKES
jgi:DNA-binding transcriptional MerR regulator